MVQYLLISSVNAIKSLPTMSVNRAAVKKLYHLKVLIYYDGIQRIEQFMFPQEAFREILLNVVVTRIIAPAILSRLAYMRIKYISGMMERCRLKHSSKPYNPKLANIFFKSGMIEAWGRGFDKIKEACVKYDGRLPEYNISASRIMVLCKA